MAHDSEACDLKHKYSLHDDIVIDRLTMIQFVSEKFFLPETDSKNIVNSIIWAICSTIQKYMSYNEENIIVPKAEITDFISHDYGLDDINKAHIINIVLSHLADNMEAKPGFVRLYSKWLDLSKNITKV